MALQEGHLQAGRQGAATVSASGGAIGACEGEECNPHGMEPARLNMCVCRTQALAWTVYGAYTLRKCWAAMAWYAWVESISGDPKASCCDSAANWLKQK